MAAGDVTTDIVRLETRYAAVFDGVDDLVVCGSAGQFDFTDLSICCKVKPTALGISHNIFSNRPSGTNFWVFKIATTNKVQFVTSVSGSSDFSQSTSDVALGEWMDLVMTFDNTTKKFNLWVNGTREVTDDVLTVGTANHGGIGYIGGIQQIPTAEEFNGFISDLRIYNRVLTSTEATDSCNGKLITDGLKSRYTFKENFNDETGRANGVNQGANLVASDTALSASINGRYVSANDKIFEMEVNNQILSAMIEEA